MFSFAMVLFPFVSEQHEKGRRSELPLLVRQYSRVLGLFALVSLCGLVFLRETLLAAYGWEFLRGSKLLFLLVIAHCLEFTRFVSMPALSGSKYAKVSAIVESLKGIFIIILFPLLYSKFDVLAIGYTFLLVQWGFSFVRLVLMKKLLGLDLLAEYLRINLVVGIFVGAEYYDVNPSWSLLILIGSIFLFRITTLDELKRIVKNPSFSS